MEVFFSGFLNFFPKPGQTVQGQEEEPEEQGGRVGGQTHRQQRRRAEQQEIEHGPQKEGRRHVEPQTAAGRQGVPQEPAGRQRPEGQVQQGAQEGEVQTPPQHPKDVVHQAQPHPQDRRPQEGPGLLGQVDAHGLPEQPGQEPAPDAAVVLVGEGVHHPLHPQVSPVQAQLFNV